MKAIEARQEARRRSVERKLPEEQPVGTGKGNPWKVTAVDTGAGTCTASPLYDVSTTRSNVSVSGIYYDTNNVPSVDDIGILVRMGDGNILFFSGEAGDKRLETTPIQIEVRTDDPVSPETGRIWLRSDL